MPETADLHARLLDRVTEAALAVEEDRYNMVGEIAALRAVVELHAPVLRFEGSEIPVCRGCDKPRMARRPPWPCSTIQTIARELGVDHGQ